MSSAMMKVIENDSELETILNRDFIQERSHYIEFGPEKIILPGRFENFYESVENFKVRDDDVFILGFLKTGTQWIQELCWLLLNDLNFKKARDVALWLRSGAFEVDFYLDSKPPKEYRNFDNLDHSESPRCLKTHLHWSLLPKAIRSGAKQPKVLPSNGGSRDANVPKIIVALRGPEDTCTSYYHQAKAMDGYTGTWEDFCKLFLGGKVPFGPYWKYVLALWEQRHQKNIIFVRYNRMKLDLNGSIREVSAFLGKSLTVEEVKKLHDHLTFDNLKNSPGFNYDDYVKSINAHVNPFVRKGIIGDYKNCMSSEVIEAFSEQRKQYLTGTGLSFD